MMGVSIHYKIDAFFICDYCFFRAVRNQYIHSYEEQDIEVLLPHNWQYCHDTDMFMCPNCAEKEWCQEE